MELYAYQRPREKLRTQGVYTLTTLELLQLIIGAGGARYSAARIARGVEKHITKPHLSYDELIAIRGLGSAKVCQLMAALELGKRTYSARDTKV